MFVLRSESVKLQGVIRHYVDTLPRSAEAQLKRHPLHVCLLLIAGSACASKAPTPVFTPDAPSVSLSPIRRERDVISRAELAEAGLQSMSVLDVVRQLRPRFLNVRGVKSSRVLAAIDNGQVMALETLASMHVAGISEIRYLSPAQATLRYGSGVGGPVIVVKTL